MPLFDDYLRREASLGRSDMGETFAETNARIRRNNGRAWGKIGLNIGEGVINYFTGNWGGLAKNVGNIGVAGFGANSYARNPGMSNNSELEMQDGTGVAGPDTREAQRAAREAMAGRIINGIGDGINAVSAGVSSGNNSNSGFNWNSSLKLVGGQLSNIGNMPDQNGIQFKSRIGQAEPYSSQNINYSTRLNKTTDPLDDYLTLRMQSDNNNVSAARSNLGVMRFADGGKLMLGNPSVNVNKIWNEDKDILEFRRLFRNKFGEEPDINLDPSIYDYREAIIAGARPSLDPTDGLYHWPSEYKGNMHPNLIVNGVNTKTNERQRMSNLLNIPSIKKDNTDVRYSRKFFAEGGVLEKVQKLQSAGALKGKNYVDYINSKVSIVPDVKSQNDIDFNEFGTDLSWVKKKSQNVNLDGLNPSLKQYLNSLPEGLRKGVLVTSGNDDDHASDSLHYSNNAVDLRFDQNLYNHIINDNIAKRMGISTINPNHGTAKHIHLQFKQLKKGGMMTKENMKMYSDKDKSEDILMFDKSTGDLMGEMRYGERIFDQKASKFMEELFKKGDSKKLGDFVLKEMGTHSDLQKFADGGPVKPTKKKAEEMGAAIDRFFGLGSGNSIFGDFQRAFPGGVKQPVFQYDLNSTLPTRNSSVLPAGPGATYPWLVDLFSNRQGQTQIPGSSVIRNSGGNSKTNPTPSGTLAKSNEVKDIQSIINGWIKSNAEFTRDANGNRILNPNFRNGKLYGPDGKAVDLGLIKEDGILGKDTADAIALFNQNPSGRKINYSIDGNKVKFDNVEQGNFLGDISPLNPRGQMSSNFPARQQSVLDQIGASSANSSGVSEDSGFNFRNFLSNNPTLTGNAFDLVRAEIAANQARNTEIPEYTLPSEYGELARELSSRRNVGYTPGQVGSFNDMQQQNRISGLAAIRGTVGQGGSSGAVLGAIGNLDRNARAAAVDFANNDEQVRQQNFSRWGNFVTNDQQRDYYQDFVPRYEQAVSNRNAYNAAAAASIQNIAQRNQVNQTYGPNSVYARYLQASSDRENRNRGMMNTAQNAPLFATVGQDGNPYGLSQTDLKRYLGLVGK